MNGWRIDFLHKKGRMSREVLTRSIWNIARDCMHGDQKTIAGVCDTYARNLPVRLICAPPEELKLRQRAIADRLSGIPNHQRSYGFVKGRSPFDCAQAHLSYWGSQPRGLTLLNIDLKNFFHSIREEVLTGALIAHKVDIYSLDQILDTCCLRPSTALAAKAVTGLLRSLHWTARSACGTNVSDIDVPIKTDGTGCTSIFCERKIPARTLDRYERALIDRLSGQIQGYPWLHMNPLPAGAAADIIIRDLLGVTGGLTSRFLPQGAPSSPVLSNLCMKLADIRLTALARSFGAFYTRYADDLTFSWPHYQKGKTIDGLKRCAIEVVGEYGLEPNPRKIRVMGPGQPQEIVGYMINTGKPTVPSAYRENVVQQVRALEQLDLRHQSDPKHLLHLMGKAGYLSLAHPDKAQALQQRIRACMNMPTSDRQLNHAGEENYENELPETRAGGELRRIFATA